MRSARKPGRNGGSVSTPGEPKSKSERISAKSKFRKLLEKVFDNCREGLRTEIDREDYQRRRFDFAFHMTDWLSDLKRLRELYLHPEKAKVHDASIFLIGFLYHTVPHLNAAGRLLLDEIPDPFAEPAMPSTPATNQRRGKPKSSRKP